MEKVVGKVIGGGEWEVFVIGGDERFDVSNFWVFILFYKGGLIIYINWEY